MSWSLKLLETMNDPSSILIKTDSIVAIKDKFPKAKHHFLVLPFDKINTIFDLTKDHIKLVKEMEDLGIKTMDLTGIRRENFGIGFHAEPSMMRVHLHVISKDFISSAFKTKKHWNSFTTSFFWPPSKIISDLETFGKVQRLSNLEAKKILDSPLNCNSCKYVAKNIPDLKKHLITHESLYSL